MPGPTNKLLILALDAANPSLLKRWGREGVLPTIGRLMSEGLAIDTRSVEGFYVGATWPSFYTSTDPSEHGIYWLDRLRPGTYRRQRGRPGDFAVEPALWEVLSRQGRRVIVLDVPLSRRSPRLRGLQVVEWGVHDAAFGFQTTPRRLARDILGWLGPHPAPTRCDARRDAAAYLTFADQLVAGAARRAALTRRLLDTNDWDFAIQVFSETHCGGHQLWHFHDPDHPSHRDRTTVATPPDGSGSSAAPGEASPDPDLLRRVYRAVDEAIGSILDSVDERTTVVVTTLHGMSHTCGGSILLSDILERLEITFGQGAAHDERGRSWETSSPSSSPPASDEPARSGPASGGSPDPSPDAARGISPIRRLYNLIPERTRERIYAIRQHVNQRLLRRGTEIDVDPERSLAFPIGLGTGSTFSGIRLNLEGREPRGRLSPGDEADRFCRDLERELTALTRPDTGLPLVRRVARTSELYHGPRVGDLPDLLIEWEPDPPMGTEVAGDGAGAVWAATSATVGRVERRNRYPRTGEHRIEGLTIVRGPGIEPGALDRAISILDLAPSFARMLGCEMPSASGRPIPELTGADSEA